MQYRAADGSAVNVSMQLHDVAAGLSIGLHARVAGGLDAWLRVGAQLTLSILDPDLDVRLASDRLLAPTAGLGLAAPHLLAIGGHWLGLGLWGRALLFGQRAENLSDGSQRGTWGGDFGGNVSADLWRAGQRGALLVSAEYRYQFTVSHFAGPSERDPTATQATLGTAEQLATLALAYAY